MTDGELFDELDYDGDGLLTRRELRQVASLFEWHWPQAPLYALLDYLIIRAPLDKSGFVSCMALVAGDPDGAYGRVLREGPIIGEQAGQRRFRANCPPNRETANGESERPDVASMENVASGGSVTAGLEDILGKDVAGRYSAVLGEVGVSCHKVRPDAAALLVIDPQRSFTSGDWMLSLGPGGVDEVIPIRRAFDNCAGVLSAVYPRAEVMFTRCPFPPESYGWYERLEEVIDPEQLYFIKPGNNVFKPATNGFTEWVDALIEAGTKVLVVGGCTLNSCVRVSARETSLRFRDDGLSVVVDMSLCGARASNYAPSPAFGGMSAVESALREMSGAGVVIAGRVDWRG